VKFTYKSRFGDCRVRLNLFYKRDQPRKLDFGFNNQMASRKLKLNPYEVTLQSDNAMAACPDPLRISIRHFMEQIARGGHNGVNILRIQHIMEELHKFYNQV